MNKEKYESASVKADRVIAYVTKYPRFWHSAVEFKKYINLIKNKQEKEKEKKLMKKQKRPIHILQEEKQ